MVCAFDLVHRDVRDVRRLRKRLPRAQAGIIASEKKEGYDNDPTRPVGLMCQKSHSEWECRCAGVGRRGGAAERAR
jgi:hypothetical protein